MPAVRIGPLVLHTNAMGWSEASARSFGQSELTGIEYPAVVTGPLGLEIDIAIFMSEEGDGMVHCPDSSGVPAEYGRLAHGARLGVYALDSQDWAIKQLRLLRFSPSKGWGNPTRTSLQELDQLLGGSTIELLASMGMDAFGSRSEVLGVKGEDLAVRWPSTAGPELPLACYALTRVLPIYEALS